jgi:hypothetical protein
MKSTKFAVSLATALGVGVLSVSAVFGAGKAISTKATLVDAMCGADVKSQADADKHTKQCALADSCASSGYGAFIDGKFHKFDASGNEKAEALFKATKKGDHITAHVEGTLEDDGSIMVSKLTEE